jgi:uncharacterized membrane protein HdeD (DUF308 family)
VNSDGRDEAIDLSRIWWLFVLVGIASLVAGAILVAKPSNSLATLAVVMGIFLLVDGVIELIGSFVRDVQNRALTAIVGVLAIVIGIILIRHPTTTVQAIGLLIGIWLVAAAAVRLIRAFVASSRPLLQIVIALIEGAVGIVIVSDPHIGYATLAIVLGIWLIVYGIGSIIFAFVIRGASST